MNNDDTNKDKTQELNYHERMQAEHKQRAENERAVEHELRTEDRYIQFFEGYNPYSVDSFIQSYKFYKVFWKTHGERWMQQNEAEDLQWVEAATRHLHIIQQKKLFDVQCFWCVEKVQYEGIEICYDFVCWSKNVMNCPFIDPLSEDDIDLYVAYLQQDNVDLPTYWGFVDDWQDYENIIEAYKSDNNGNRNFPEWYDFYNGRRGTGIYMGLPDVRGDKEKHYDNLGREFFRKQNEQKVAEAELKRDKRPFLPSHYDKSFMRYFIDTFENKQLREYYEAYLRHHINDHKKESLQNNISLLLTSDEPIYLEPHLNWTEAIERATQRFRAKKIAEHLPTAFEQYEIQKSLGIVADKSPAGNHLDDIRAMHVKFILKGRELCGEPQDFNF
ncbi:MAG: hypothetical protein IPN22_11605 [Bacteroidetes bacterium]|nr:hypothetical protein [Bacteroidota bacterium]